MPTCRRAQTQIHPHPHPLTSTFGLRPPGQRIHPVRLSTFGLRPPDGRMHQLDRELSAFGRLGRRNPRDGGGPPCWKPSGRSTTLGGHALGRPAAGGARPQAGAARPARKYCKKWDLSKIYQIPQYTRQFAKKMQNLWEDPVRLGVLWGYFEKTVGRQPENWNEKRSETPFLGLKVGI